MADAWSVSQAQCALGEITFQLLAVRDALEEIHRTLPLPADLECRLEHVKAPDVATEAMCCIECVLEDCIRPAICSLQRASQATDEELERAFRAKP